MSEPFVNRGERSQNRAEREAYEAAVAWLEALIRPITGTAPPRTPAYWREEGPRRLARLRRVLTALGEPQQRYRTLHVAGTSGKGSVCTYLGAVLLAAGFRTGVHTTPYLQVPMEKLQVDGRYAAPGAFVELVRDLRARLGDEIEDLTYPALSVALTYLYFAHQHVDVAVVETSVGGRYDWTNTLDPEVAVITTVGPDHLSTLGPTLEDIAYHKAGVIRPGVPAVTGVQRPELAVVEREAATLGSPLLRLGQEFRVDVKGCTDTGTRFDYASPSCSLADLETGMLGRYQAFNAGLAVAALRAFGERVRPLSEEALRAGLRDARLAGRMELIQRSPDVLLDGAHNPEKAAALARSLDEIFPNRRLRLVIGALSSKDVSGILAPFRQRVREVIVTVPHVLGKSGLEPERLARAVAEAGMAARVEPEPAAAVRRAMAGAGAGDLVCVTGSLYLVGEVRRLWVPDEVVLETGTSCPPASCARNALARGSAQRLNETSENSSSGRIGG